MQVVASASPQFSTGTPSVRHFDGAIRMSMPLINIGTGTATSVTVDQITLNNVPAIGTFLPRMIGTLGQGNIGAVRARFASSPFAVGGRYILRVRGRYRSNGVLAGFIVNRTIAVPPQTVAPIELLRGRVDHLFGGGMWEYTIFNDEPIASPHSIVAFSLDIVAPVNVTGTPVGWQVIATDHSLLWHVADLTGGYELRPGAFTGGFALTSNRLQSEGTAFSLSAWNYASGEAGPAAFGATASPARA
jgi:hypothetical protein